MIADFIKPRKRENQHNRNHNLGWIKWLKPIILVTQEVKFREDCDLKPIQQKVARPHLKHGWAWWSVCYLRHSGKHK
jgi:hypothetical protein